MPLSAAIAADVVVVDGDDVVARADDVDAVVVGGTIARGLDSLLDDVSSFVVLEVAESVSDFALLSAADRMFFAVSSDDDDDDDDVVVAGAADEDDDTDDMIELKD